ncbi:MAG: hypothetical protein IJV25_03160 [Prevotella sp.]|nr:hypothetical protein [Prevotella sp.]
MKQKRMIFTLLTVAAFWCVSPQYVSARTKAEKAVTQAKSASKQLEFMGIPVHQSKNQLIAQLKTKGFTEKKDAKGKPMLCGTYDGKEVKARVFTYTIMIEDLKHYTLAQAKTRFEALLTKTKATYGNGKFTSNSSNFKVYEIKCQGGTVSVMLTNEDEMHGKSNLYVVGIGFYK